MVTAKKNSSSKPHNLAAASNIPSSHPCGNPSMAKGACGCLHSTLYGSRQGCHQRHENEHRAVVPAIAVEVVVVLCRPPMITSTGWSVCFAVVWCVTGQWRSKHVTKDDVDLERLVSRIWSPDHSQTLIAPQTANYRVI